jgi:hypothetical protein
MVDHAAPFGRHRRTATKDNDQSLHAQMLTVNSSPSGTTHGLALLEWGQLLDPAMDWDQPQVARLAPESVPPGSSGGSGLHRCHRRHETTILDALTGMNHSSRCRGLPEPGLGRPSLRTLLDPHPSTTRIRASPSRVATCSSPLPMRRRPGRGVGRCGASSPSMRVASTEPSSTAKT